MKEEDGQKINRIHRAPNIAKATFSSKVGSEKIFLLKMSILEVDSNLYKEKE